MRIVLPAGALIFAVLLSSHAQNAGPDRLFNQAIAEQSQGDYLAAIRDYRRYLAGHSNSVEARANLGAALAHIGEFDDAIEQYQSAIRALPPGSSALGKLQLNLALAFFKKGDMKSACAQLEPLYRVQSKDARIATLLGDADTRLGDAAAAVAVLAPLAAANENNPDFGYVYGSALVRSGERRKGAAVLEKVAGWGHGADAYMFAGSTLLDLNEFQRAREDLEAALALDPKLPGLYSLVGMARDRTGDAKNAEPAFRQALQETPEDFNANLYLGAILLKQRNLPEAKRYLEKALALDPGSSMARYEDAMLQSTSGEYEAAAVELEKLVAADPDWLQPHVELATLYYRLHKPEQGARERAIVDRLAAAQQANGSGKP